MESSDSRRSGVLPKKTQIQLAGINRHKCGYCKAEGDTSVSYGVLSPYMTVEDYQQLMLLGWRRSGSYFYKPLMHETCCPMYTIRLPVQRFQPTKEQRKVLRRATRKAMSADTTSEVTKPPSSFPEPQHQGNDTANCEISISIERSSFSQEKFLLYRKYQVVIHHDQPDEVTRESFSRFLVDSPLSDVVQNKYGSFHHLYRLNSQLVAVGVVDMLPSGLSSVYLFYDPDRKDLILGKYSALKEIEYCQKNGFDYYCKQWQPLCRCTRTPPSSLRSFISLLCMH